MLGKILLTLAVALLSARAAAQTCTGYPYTLTNGTPASASQVMADINCAALLGAARFAGNVGIGASSPSTLLSLGGAVTTIKLGIYDAGGSNVYGIGVNPGELTFGAAIAPTGVPQMVLTAAGNVGIGTTGPTSVLDLSDAITTIKLAVYEDETQSIHMELG